MKDDISTYLRGTKLYGDDFSASEIKAWYESEKQGYHDIYEKNYVRPPYGYHLFNKKFGFDLLPKKKLHHTLGFGAGNGDELQTVINKCDRITILDQTNSYTSKKIGSTSISYARPKNDGELEFNNNTFDLICCFSALHHIPNVSFVLKEFYRCLIPGGHLILREPVVSMGDWRKPRKGLTKNERGIPIRLFDEAIYQAGFKIINRKHVLFPLLPRLAKLLKIKDPYNYSFFISTDRLLCNLTKWNKNYHATSSFQKIRPVALAYVLEKPIQNA